MEQIRKSRGYKLKNGTFVGTLEQKGADIRDKGRGALTAAILKLVLHQGLGLSERTGQARSACSTRRAGACGGERWGEPEGGENFSGQNPGSGAGGRGPGR